jgi:hypothetical protein
VLETDPVNFESLITLGKLKYFKGELEEARDLFDRALVVRPELEKTMYRLGRVLYDMQQFDRSKLLLEQVDPAPSVALSLGLSLSLTHASTSFVELSTRAGFCGARVQNACVARGREGAARLMQQRGAGGSGLPGRDHGRQVRPAHLP